MPQDDTRSDHAPDKKRRFWQAHIKCWGHSGQTQVACCRENGLASHQFTYWKKRFNRHADAGVADPVRFLGGQVITGLARQGLDLQILDYHEIPKAYQFISGLNGWYCNL